jgi:hypothetical protein
MNERLYWASEEDDFSPYIIQSSAMDGSDRTIHATVPRDVVETEPVLVGVDESAFYVRTHWSLVRILRSGSGDAATAEEPLSPGGFSELPQAFALDDEGAYWSGVNTQSGVGHDFLRYLPKDRATPSNVLLDDLNQPNAVAVDKDRVYVAGSFMLDQDLFSVRRDGTDPHPFSTGFYASLRLDEDHLYWIAADKIGIGFSHFRVARMAKGTAPDSGPPAIEVVYDEQTYPSALSLDGADVYFTDDEDLLADFSGQVKRVPKAGGAAEIIATGLNSSAPIVFTDSQFIYWVDAGYYRVNAAEREPGTGGVFRAPKNRAAGSAPIVCTTTLPATTDAGADSARPADGSSDDSSAADTSAPDARSTDASGAGVPSSSPPPTGSGDAAQETSPASPVRGIDAQESGGNTAPNASSTTPAGATTPGLAPLPHQSVSASCSVHALGTEPGGRPSWLAMAMLACVGRLARRPGAKTQSSSLPRRRRPTSEELQ